MKKQDLKTGMIIETRDGKFGKVLLNTSRGDIVGGINDTGNYTWFPLDILCENLTHGEDNPATDIIAVYEMTASNAYAASIGITGTCLWRENKPEEMTLEQICQELGRNVKIVK